MAKITCISDLHGYIPPDLEEGDLLIVAGDLTATDEQHEYFEVFNWISRQPFKEKILVAGNHDRRMEKEKYQGPVEKEFHYLEDEGIELLGLKIWATPRSLWFDGINPACKAFTSSERGLSAKFEEIPNDLDILISHGPMKGVLDLCYNGHVGSVALKNVVDRVGPKLLVTGHIHEQGGNQFVYKGIFRETLCVNCAYVNQYFDPENEIIKITM